MECGGLPECFHGFKELDKKGFQALVRSEEALTVDEIADAVDRKRSTAYRAVQRPLQTGFIEKDQINYDEGGYYHVYSPTGSSKIADDAERLPNDWYAKSGQLIQEFELNYEQSETAVPATES